MTHAIMLSDFYSSECKNETYAIFVCMFVCICMLCLCAYLCIHTNIKCDHFIGALLSSCEYM